MSQTIRQGDNIEVIRGKDRGRRGKVQRVLPKDGRVVVEGLNLVTRHLKAGPNMRQAGRVQQEAALHISNVQLVCGRCNQPSRMGFRDLDDGSKVRFCRRCNEAVE